MPSHLHAAAQNEDKTSSIQQHKYASHRARVLNKTREIAPLNNANDTIVSSITTPTTTPMIEFLRDNAPVARGRRARAAPNQDRMEKKAAKAKKEAEERARRKEEAEEKRMTPAEYAKKVQTKFTAKLEKIAQSKNAEEKLFLKGKCIFYICGDRDKTVPQTRDKMDFVRIRSRVRYGYSFPNLLLQIRMKGGTVCPTYDPGTVTHIVCEPFITEGGALKALKLKNLEEIPDHIPTVRWEWITTGTSGKLAIEFLHAAFSSRIHACPSKAPKLVSEKGKGKEPEPKSAGIPTILESEHSVIE